MVDMSSSQKFADFEKESGEKFEYQQPTLRDEFQSARLFLSHIGFLSLDILPVWRIVSHWTYIGYTSFFLIL